MTTTLLLASAPTTPRVAQAIHDDPCLTLLPCVTNVTEVIATLRIIQVHALLMHPTTHGELVHWGLLLTTAQVVQTPRIVVAPASLLPLPDQSMDYIALISWPCPSASLAALIQRVATRAPVAG